MPLRLMVTVRQGPCPGLSARFLLLPARGAETVRWQGANDWKIIEYSLGDIHNYCYLCTQILPFTGLIAQLRLKDRIGRIRDEGISRFGDFGSLLWWQTRFYLLGNKLVIPKKKTLWRSYYCIPNSYGTRQHPLVNATFATVSIRSFCTMPYSDARLSWRRRTVVCHVVG